MEKEAIRIRRAYELANKAWREWLYHFLSDCSAKNKDLSEETERSKNK